MPSVLLDAGALVAILNRNDHFHSEITELLKEHQGAILTTWPVVAEACGFFLEEAAQGAAAIACEFEQGFLLVATVGEMPDVIRQKMAVGARHDFPPLRACILLQKSCLQASGSPPHYVNIS